MIFSKKIQQY